MCWDQILDQKIFITVHRWNYNSNNCNYYSYACDLQNGRIIKVKPSKREDGSEAASGWVFALVDRLYSNHV